MSLKEDILELRKNNKTYKEISNILDCSSSIVGHHCRNNDLGGNIKLDSIYNGDKKKCPNCEEFKDLEKFNSQNSYCLICHNIKNKNWKEENFEKYNESQKNYEDRNNYERQKLYKKSEKGIIINRKSSNKYRVKRRNCKGSHTYEEWKEKLKENDYSCVCCESQEKITKDHIIPLSKGGTDNIDNLQPLCLSCNAIKNDRLLSIEELKEIVL